MGWVHLRVRHILFDLVFLESSTLPNLCRENGNDKTGSGRGNGGGGGIKGMLKRKRKAEEEEALEAKGEVIPPTEDSAWALWKKV